MFEGNKQFEAFRDKLNANGVMMRCMWETYSGIDWRSRGSRRPEGVTLAQWKKWPDVALYSFCIVGQSERFGTGPCPVEKLAITTAILLDYGENGFGIWLSAKTNKIDDDIAAILGTTHKAKEAKP